MQTDLLEGGSLVFPASWPELAPTGRVVVEPPRSYARLDPPYVVRLVASLAPIPADPTLAPYLDLLDRRLRKRTLFRPRASSLGLTREQVVGAHLSYMEGLVGVALADGVITKSEKRDLDDVARLLGIPIGTLDALISDRRSPA